VLIIRRSNCINTASGIVFSVSDRPVCTADGHLQTRVAVNNTIRGSSHKMVQVFVRF